MLNQNPRFPQRTLNNKVNRTNKNPGFVTINEQKRLCLKGLSLRDIIIKNGTNYNFKPYLFPEFNVMTNGDIFFDPCVSIINVSRREFVKWFVLDKQWNISHDNSYNFVRLPKEGYMMKISIPIVSDTIESFEVEYVVDITNINIIESFEVEHVVDIDTNHIFALNDPHLMEVDSLNTIESIDVTKYPEFIELINDTTSFIKKYLTDIQ